MRKWKLRVEGDVKEPRDFTYAELSGMEQETLTATLECAGNGRRGFRKVAPNEVPWGPGAVATARWTGVPVSKLLHEVGFSEGAKELIAEGADSGPNAGSKKRSRYQRALPLAKALAKGTLLALKMNGLTLPPDHGYPVRMVVPGWYGMASVKWVSRLTVSSGRPFDGYYNTAKYVYVTGASSDREPVREVRVKSMVTSPDDGAMLKVGSRVTISGKGWSGGGKVVRVEVDPGDGWKEARITRRPGRFAWVTWRMDWTPKKKGITEILSKATDDTGTSQPDEPFENAFQYGFNRASGISVRVI